MASQNNDAAPAPRNHAEEPRQIWTLASLRRPPPLRPDIMHTAFAVVDDQHSDGKPYKRLLDAASGYHHELYDYADHGAHFAHVPVALRWDNGTGSQSYHYYRIEFTADYRPRAATGPYALGAPEPGDWPGHYATRGAARALPRAGEAWIAERIAEQANGWPMLQEGQFVGDGEAVPEQDGHEMDEDDNDGDNKDDDENDDDHDEGGDDNPPHNDRYPQQAIAAAVAYPPLHLPATFVAPRSGGAWAAPEVLLVVYLELHGPHRAALRPRGFPIVQLSLLVSHIPPPPSLKH